VHDWWACLFVAAIGGTILFDCTPEILYRQHSANVFGASNSYLRRMLRALSRGTEAYNAQLISHVGALLENKQQLSLEVVRVLQKIQHGYAGGRHERLSLFRLPGFRRQTNIENALLALWLLFTSTKTVNQ
jgi:hypothetical protein